MQYREIDYQVVHTSGRAGWKWTVQFGPDRLKTGNGFSRMSAIGLAQRAIDKALEIRGKEPEQAT